MNSRITSARRQLDSGPVAGRLVLLFGAYAPVALIIGARVVPACIGYVAIGLGLVGLAAWLGFLRWLPGRQPRTAKVDSDIELIDTEVTGYIVSILLPLVAAGDPTTGDLVAYGLCGVLILFVAYASNLAAVNPFIYFFGFRVIRATVDGERTVALTYEPHESAGEAYVVHAIGVTLILGKVPPTEGE